MDDSDHYATRDITIPGIGTPYVFDVCSPIVSQVLFVFVMNSSVRNCFPENA